jgi:hypothetical protein
VRDFCIRRNVWKYAIKIEHRSRTTWMGRFGGGWQWSLGIQVGSNTTIINLLVISIRIDRPLQPRPDRQVPTINEVEFLKP